MIDPDASSDDNEMFMKLKMKKGGKPSQMELDELENQKNAKKEAARKKEKIKQMKEISKNFDRKDKRETHKFLMKHGLTLDEAKEYT